MHARPPPAANGEQTGAVFSVLDLAPIVAGSSAAEALHNSLDLARHAEQWGYHRFWLAEHHNMPGVASAATAVAIGYVAGGTKTLRVGAGGVMLPNHAPLVIAEQFGTLASLYPGRIDLGIGRAPGTDPLTVRALRRNPAAGAESFPSDVVELMRYFEPERPNQPIRAVPGAGSQVPVWLLGSSLYSAELAAELGLPFAFAAHFAPELLMPALELYRSRFRASAARSEPYTLVCTNVYAADSDDEARRLFTSLELAFLALRAGRPGPLPPPVERSSRRDLEAASEPLAQLFRYAVVGARNTVRDGIAEFLRATRADELMVTAMIYDHAARLRSFEIVADVARELGAAAPAAQASGTNSLQ